MSTSNKELIQILERVLIDKPRINEAYFVPGSDSIIFHATLNGIGGIYFHDNSGNENLITDGLNIKGSVGYGGGNFDLSNQYVVAMGKSGSVFLMKHSPVSKPLEIFSGSYRLADPKISPDEQAALMVFDRNEQSGIGAIDIQKTGDFHEIAKEADFHMHPTWHPNGETIAWAEWDHPYMPWDASRVMIGRLSPKRNSLLETRHIAGDINRSASQPQFSPNGKYLSYIVRNGNWDDIMLRNVATGDEIVVHHGEGFHLHLPDWVQGQQSYGWTSDSKFLVCIRYHQATASLVKIEIEDGKITPFDTKEYGWISHLAISPDKPEILCIGSSTNNPGEIVRIKKNKITRIKKRNAGIDQPEPREIIFRTKDGLNAYAWYYPPKPETTERNPPPCILKFHSGPTAVAHPGYSRELDIFTSLGYAMVYLNYRGSVTYGYDYQYALQRRWGETETEDADYLIQTLDKQGYIHPERLALMGSSAGGYSLLHMFIKHPGRFKAAICSYAVSDLVDDAQNTHKFERYYHQFLTGQFPEEKNRFIERSPITHIEKIRDPIAIFHGEDDPVVSPRQSELIYAQLKARGIPALLRIYKDEGHGFYKKETLFDYYQAIHSFLKRFL